MNCKKARTALLLAESGELAAEPRRALDRHLSGCAECRRYAASLRSLRGEYGASPAPPATATPPPTLNAILIAARETAQQSATARRNGFLKGWTWSERALAAAAGLLAVLGLTIGLSRLAGRGAAVAWDSARIERQVATAIEALEAEWTAWESEMALVALEISDWYLIAGDAAAEAFPAPDPGEAGI